VGKRHDFGVIRKPYKDDLIWKAVYREATHVRIIDAEYTTANLRKRLDQLEGLSNLGRESQRDPRIAIAIPRCFPG
jgi:hypothetical protein